MLRNAFWASYFLHTTVKAKSCSLVQALSRANGLPQSKVASETHQLDNSISEMKKAHTLTYFNKQAVCSMK